MNHHHHSPATSTTSSTSSCFSAEVWVARARNTVPESSSTGIWGQLTQSHSMWCSMPLLLSTTVRPHSISPIKVRNLSDALAAPRREKDEGNCGCFVQNISCFCYVTLFLWTGLSVCRRLRHRAKVGVSPRTSWVKLFLWPSLMFRRAVPSLWVGHPVSVLVRSLNAWQHNTSHYSDTTSTAT